MKNCCDSFANNISCEKYDPFTSVIVVLFNMFIHFLYFTLPICSCNNAKKTTRSKKGLTEGTLLKESKINYWVYSPERFLH